MSVPPLPSNMSLPSEEPELVTLDAASACFFTNACLRLFAQISLTHDCEAEDVIANRPDVCGPLQHVDVNSTWQLWLSPLVQSGRMA